jgi:hypothetical protein
MTDEEEVMAEVINEENMTETVSKYVFIKYFCNYYLKKVPLNKHIMN